MNCSAGRYWIIYPALPRSVLLVDSLTKIFNRPLQTFAQGNRRLPAERVLSLGDVGFTLARIVRGQRHVREAGLGFARLDHFFCKLFDRELTWITEVHWTIQSFDIHETNQSFEQVFDVTEGARLFAFTVECQR